MGGGGARVFSVSEESQSFTALELSICEEGWMWSEQKLGQVVVCACVCVCVCVCVCCENSITPIDGFHEAWLHFWRSRVGVCVQCGCVQNTGKKVLH